MKLSISPYFITFLLICFTFVLTHAQPVLPDPPDQAPIEPGLWILGAWGAVYAMRKLRSRKQ